MTELAEREGIAPSYMTRVMRLTLLAPDIVDTILEGKQGPEVTLARMLEPFPLLWEEQPVQFCRATPAAQSRPSGDYGRAALRPVEPDYAKTTHRRMLDERTNML